MRRKLLLLILFAFAGAMLCVFASEALAAQKKSGSAQAKPVQQAAAQDSGKDITVEVDGYAPVKNGDKNSAREEARREAYRAALEKAMGAFVAGVTEMQNYEIVKDKVFSQTQGLVKKFDILSEKVDEDGVFILTARCVVGEAALDGVLGPVVIDALGNPRVMVLIDERIGSQKPFLSTTEGGVLAVFEKAGFLLVDPDQARALLNIDSAVAYDDPAQLMDAARTLMADVIIVGKAQGSEYTTQRVSGQLLHGVRSTVQLKAVLTKTAYQLGSQVVEEKKVGISEEDGAIKAFQAAAPASANSIVHKVAYAMVSGTAGGIPGVTVKVILSGVSYEKSEAILEGLRELAGKSGGVYERGMKDGLLEVDVTSEKNVRNVASFLSENGIGVDAIDGQIIKGKIADAGTAAGAVSKGAAVTVKITGVPSFDKASEIEDALVELVGGGGNVNVDFKDNNLDITVVSEKSARDLASFLSKQGVEITGRTSDSVEGKMK